mmetsp:Transcript_101/g.147  ORF Transcript_101/g.147 Transcript_101/m.147 type:complete len:203 (-) Transcript_101:33-641(-)
MSSNACAEDAKERHQELFALCSDVMVKMQSISQPVITAVHGIATAAGCQLVAASDIAIASPTAKFSTPGVRIGLFCHTPAVQIARSVPRKTAMYMLLTGEFINADDARAFGLISKLCEKGENTVEDQQLVQMEGFKLARKVADASGVALGMGKQTFYKQIDLDLERAYVVASQAMTDNMCSGDAEEGINSFLQKRQPKWSHK